MTKRVLAVGRVSPVRGDVRIGRMTTEENGEVETGWWLEDGCPLTDEEEWEVFGG